MNRDENIRAAVSGEECDNTSYNSDLEKENTFCTSSIYNGKSQLLPKNISSTSNCLENPINNDEEFRTEFIEEWMSFKEYILDTNTLDGKNDSDDAGMFKGSSYKRSSFDTFSAFGSTDIDDLYNLDGLTGSKRQKLGF